MFNWNGKRHDYFTSCLPVSVNRWIVFNWNKNLRAVPLRGGFVSVNRWIVFNWNAVWRVVFLERMMFQLIVG